MADENNQEKSAKRESRKRAQKPQTSSTAVLAVVALAVGAGCGWAARGAAPKAEAGGSARPIASAAAGVSGPCEEWSSELCKRTGEASEGCTKAKAAASLLPGAACTAAKADLEGTVAKLKAARASCDTLVEKICKDLGEKSNTCAMVREKTPSFPADRCKDMLDHFDGVIAELREMEQDSAPISADLAQRQAAADAPGFGPADAKITIVEYSDFECPFCGRAASVVGKLKEKYGSKVRFVFRQFPLQMHAHAKLAAEASLAAHAQGKFWAFHDLLFQNQRDLERASLEKYAQGAGLDMAKFKKALDEHTYANAVSSDMKLGVEGHVSGTPSMFIGTERVENATDFDALSSEIDKRLSAVN
ncbi:DSBA-like thioredoxin domain protein [Minicystis rosea]|nr:DSBA-like thioredoxin domain protein [Minicystis rosea]